MSELISIVTPCFNSEKTIENTLRSMLSQTYSTYEYIVVDGGSSDGTLKIIEKYIPLFDGRISVISEPDQGIYDAMNKGIRHCTGKMIGIINSDDTYTPNALQDVMDLFEDGKYQIIYGMMRIIENGQEVKTVLNRHEFLRRDMIGHPASFVSKNVYDDFGMYNLKYRSCADYEFMLRMFDSNRVSFMPIYKILANYSVGGFSSSKASLREHADFLYEYGIISRREHILRRLKLLWHFMHLA